MDAFVTTLPRPMIVWLARLVVVALCSVMLSVALATPAAAEPPPGALEDAGWTCFEHLDAWHCGPNVDELFADEEPNTVTMLTWGLDDDGEPDEFWGTELLVHDDVYRGQPCPQDPLQVLGDGTAGAYVDVADLGVSMPYVVCHRFDSPNT